MVSSFTQTEKPTKLLQSVRCPPNTLTKPCQFLTLPHCNTGIEDVHSHGYGFLTR